MTDQTLAAGLIRDLAIAAAGPHPLTPGKVHAWLAGGTVQQVDLTGDQYRDYPKRKTGTVTVRDVAAFTRYYQKHADDGSEVYADLDTARVTAVLDAHSVYQSGLGGDNDGARWQQHRLILALQPTLAWREWTGADRQMMTQQAFAEFIEDHARDIAADGPVKSADLLEVAQHFQAHVKIQVTRGMRLASGQTQLQYMEEIDAKAGDRGEITIPSEFDLAVVPYTDCEPRLLAARLRYRIGGDKALSLGYFLNDPARTARDAVGEVIAKLEAACEITVMHGTPAT